MFGILFKSSFSLYLSWIIINYILDKIELYNLLLRNNLFSSKQLHFLHLM